MQAVRRLGRLIGVHLGVMKSPRSASSSSAAIAESEESVENQWSRFDTDSTSSVDERRNLPHKRETEEAEAGKTNETDSRSSASLEKLPDLPTASDADTVDVVAPGAVADWRKKCDDYFAQEPVAPSVVSKFKNGKVVLYLNRRSRRPHGRFFRYYNLVPKEECESEAVTALLPEEDEEPLDIDTKTAEEMSKRRDLEKAASDSSWTTPSLYSGSDSDDNSDVDSDGVYVVTNSTRIRSFSDPAITHRTVASDRALTLAQMPVPRQTLQQWEAANPSPDDESGC